MNNSPQTVPRQAIIDKIHPNNRHLIPDEVVVEDVLPYDLLFHPKRFDAMAKYIYAKHWKLGIDSDWARRLYLEHLRIIAPGYTEGDGSEKKGIPAFIKAFDEILSSVAAKGFDPELNVIPVNEEGVIIDGAHRLAACAAFDRIVTIVRPVRHYLHDYSSSWFVAKGFPLKWADAVVAEFCRLNGNSYIAIVWPKAIGRDQEIRNALNAAGRVYYEKRISLYRNGPVNLMKVVYGHHSWIGSWSDGYSGAVGGAAKYFEGDGDVRIFVFDCPSPSLVLKAKSDIRALFGIGNYSIHINDTHEEAVTLSQMLLNENSIHFLIHAPVKELESFNVLFSRFKEALASQRVGPESFCVDSSMVLAAYGVREARDLDVLHHGHDDLVSRLDPAIGSHNAEGRYYDCSIDEVIFNPERHFYVNGVKYASLDVVCVMKQQRGEEKDKRDLRLVRLFLERGRVSEGSGFLGRWRGRLKSGILRAGLIPVFLRLRSTVGKIKAKFVRACSVYTR
jgi:hypothetical protein